MNTLPKKKINKFGDHYLLGKDTEGVQYWLEAPRWSCDWYWGFGYIHSFTNNRSPELSRDIQSLEHAEDFMLKWFRGCNDNARLAETTFTEKEGWELCELFKQFYFLRESAEHFGRGKCHVADTSAPLWQKPELAKEINEVLIPPVMDRILQILSPTED